MIREEWVGLSAVPMHSWFFEEDFLPGSLWKKERERRQPAAVCGGGRLRAGTRKKWAEKILTCAKTFLSVTMVLQVPQDGKNFSGHMFIGLIVELPAKVQPSWPKDQQPVGWKRKPKMGNFCKNPQDGALPWMHLEYLFSIFLQFRTFYTKKGNSWAWKHFCCPIVEEGPRHTELLPRRRRPPSSWFFDLHCLGMHWSVDAP